MADEIGTSGELNIGYDDNSYDDNGDIVFVDAPADANSGDAGSVNVYKIVTASGNPIIDGILSGVAWKFTNFSVSYPTSGLSYGFTYGNGENQTFTAFTQAQKLVADFARSLLADYTPITFVAGTEASANLRYGNFQAGNNQSTHGNYPDGFPGMGDMWYSQKNGDQGNGTIGGFAYTTIFHEQGHTLGLKHGQDTGINGGVAKTVDGTVIPNYAPLPAANDDWNYTVMTYRSYQGATTDPVQGFLTSDNPVTYMMADIAAMQYMYGANFAGVSSTNTLYQWDAAGNKFVNGTLFLPSAVNGKIFETVWDGGGNDTYDTSNFSTNQTIDLRPGAFSTIDPTKLADLDRFHPGTQIALGNVANALLYQNDLRSLIENAVTGNGNDVITGNQAANLLSGNGGNDFIDAGAGSDTLSGGAGNDTLLGGDALALNAAQKSIYRLYGATLDREPDVPGLLGWVNVLGGGSSLVDTAAGFVNSPEFQAKYGALNNTQFVTQLYANVLRRGPDAGGLAGWVGQLDGGASRQSVVVGFSESGEYQGNTEIASQGYATTGLFGASYGQIYRLYGATLNRAPDAGGFEGWVNAMSGGQSLASITTGFVGSAEFQATYGALNSTQFVTLLYSNVLHRAPDAGGLAGWVGALNGGASRESVVNGFSESAEYQTTTAAPLKSFVRTVMTTWADTLDGGAGDDILFGARGSDTFRFDRTAPGNDQIFGFESWDTLNLVNFGYASTAAAVGHITQSGANVVFADQGETITIRNTQLAIVTAANFSFV